MSGVIKSLTTKIGADTSDFVKELKKVDKELRTTQKEANELQKGLELKFDAGRFTQAQKQVQIALSQTEDKADAIRKQLKILEQSGKIDTDAYKKLQLELAKAENNAEKLKNQLDELDKIKLQNLTKGFDDFGNKMDSAGRKMAGLSLAATGAIAGMGKLAQNARQVGDDIATNAVKFDMSTDAIQKWQYVAMQSDVSANSLFKAANKIRAAYGDQITGVVTTATKALDQLGLNMSQFETNEDAFQGTILALSKIEDTTLQAAYANDIFGERFAAELIPLLQTGTDAIAEYIGEFNQVGYLSEEQVTKLAEFDNVLNKVNARFDIAKVKLGEALLPILEVGAEILEEAVIPAMEKFTGWFGSLDEGVQKALIGGLGFVAMLSPMLIMIGKVSTGVGAMIKLFKSLNATTIKTTAGFMALAGALTLGINLITDWNKMSTIEKVLKTLAVAALTAAAAMAVFHASASVGLAVGAITAGIVAAIAAVESAKKKIMPDEPSLDVDVEGISQGRNDNYNLPSRDNAGSYIEDNSKIEVNIEMNPTGELDYDAKSLADEVIKQIVIQKQALGR